MKRMRLTLLLAIVLTVTLFTGVVSAETVYTVKSGDVLWRIAREYGTDWQTLAQYNNLENPHLIFPYQQIKIPDEETASTKTLTLLHTNDMHGFFIEGDYDGMGAAKMAAFFKTMKTQNPGTLILDAGDATQGNNLVTLSKGENAVKVLNALGYDAMTTGNHEFDYGLDHALKNRDMLNFPMLAANVKDAQGNNVFEKYIIREIDGVKVGIFGLATPETTYKSHPKNTEGLTFESPVETAKIMAAELDPVTDVIVALVHLGDEGNSTSAMVATEVQGIDVMIDGHSHSTYENGQMINGVLIASAGEKTKNIGVVNLTVENNAVVSKSAELFTKEDSANIADDADMTILIDELKAQNSVIEQEVVAVAPYVLDGERADVRTGETNLGNLITASLLDVSGADVALTNGGGIRTSVDAGEVTKGEVLTVLPFGNTVAVIELTGADIVAAVENGIDAYPEPKGAFPHIAGMTVKFDSSKPAGERVVSLMIGNSPVDQASTYTLVTNDFLAAGGDGYDMFTDKKVVAEFSAMDEILINYLNDKGFDAGTITDRIIDVNESESMDTGQMKLDPAA